MQPKAATSWERDGEQLWRSLSEQGLCSCVVRCQREEMWGIAWHCRNQLCVWQQAQQRLKAGRKGELPPVMVAQLLVSHCDPLVVQLKPALALE